jgi:hypothetical protein
MSVKQVKHLTVRQLNKKHKDSNSNLVPLRLPNGKLAPEGMWVKTLLKKFDDLFTPEKE